MKSVIKLSLALILTLSLTNCGGGKGSKSSNTNVSANTTNTEGNNTFPKYSCEGGEVVNGFTLPPCPDQEENDKTLLGIDSNNNGVRDDVERWLIVRYKDNHKIVTEIGFQGARASQIVIQDPSKARETTKFEEAAQACNSYFEFWAQYNNEPILIDHDIITSTAFNTIQFNTEERIRAYLAYDRKLSGGVYELPKGSKAHRALCAFDVDKMLGE